MYLFGSIGAAVEELLPGAESGFGTRCDVELAQDDVVHSLILQQHGYLVDGRGID